MISHYLEDEQLRMACKKNNPTEVEHEHTNIW